MATPHPPDVPPPWTVRDVAIAIFLVIYFWPQLSLELLATPGSIERLFGADAVALARPSGQRTQPASEERQLARERVAFLAGPGAARLDLVEAEARRMALTRLGLWASVAAFPFQAVTVPLVFYVLRGIPPGRIGLTQRLLGRNVLAGVGAWLLITPLVFVVNLLATYLQTLADPGGVQEHPLTRIAEQRPTAPELAVLVVSAVVAAPVVEETVFRGVLQPWFAGFRSGGATAMAAAFGAALVPRQSEMAAALRHGGEGLLTAVAPALFVLALLPFYLAVARHPPRPDSPAIFGTALLFASIHANVWPTPVPLFVLGLALGTLSARTGSLVGPMVLHGLFNAVTCVWLLFAGQ
jgi:membrane protease YdiL (CAAX protease family)